MGHNKGQQMKDFYLTKSNQYKLRIKVSDCEVPVNLKRLEFVNEHYDITGELTGTSTYEFFLNQEAINRMCEQLSS